LAKHPQLHRYLRHGHKFVEGWMLPGAARIIVALGTMQDAEAIAGNVAEIGVHHGKLFILMYLLTRDGEHAVAIDLFSDQARNIEQSGAGDLNKFRTNLCRYADTRRLVVYEGDSTTLDGKALTKLAGGACRLISIDGGHTPEITAHDLATAEGALAPGGVIILDDCFNELWPGVSEGVYRYFRERRGLVPFATGGNKTFFSGSPSAARYADALRNVPTKIAERDFLGSPVLCCDFAPLTLAESLGRWRVWRDIRDRGPLKIARRVYRVARAAMG
jgi:hypothetical protein